MLEPQNGIDHLLIGWKEWTLKYISVGNMVSYKFSILIYINMFQPLDELLSVIETYT